ncbi:MAG: sulfatase-like hydrolase/transferase [Actinomycetota bacterium]|jgi:arylsulfatase A-like enzyme
MIPAPQDEDVRAPGYFESPAYNERNVSDKPQYVRDSPLLGQQSYDKMSAQWDHTYGTLRSVDRWLGRFERALPDPVRTRTIFIFTSDNGYEWGDHRLKYKEYPYERSIRVPLIMAGPGIPQGSSDALVQNADLTPTILDLAGLPGGPFDECVARPGADRVGTASPQRDPARTPDDDPPPVVLRPPHGALDLRAVPRRLPGALRPRAGSQPVAKRGVAPPPAAPSALASDRRRV